jgi:anti-sigma B factor antagonist
MRVLMDAIEIASVGDGTRVQLRRTLALRMSGDPAAAGAGGGADAGAGTGPDVAAVAGARVAFEREREVTVARLEGEVDLVGVGELGRALAHATRAGDRGLVLDVNGVGYLDSAGLHLLHDTSRTLAARGQSLRVVAAPDAEIARLLELADIGQTVPVDASVGEAVDALASPPVL